MSEQNNFENHKLILSDREFLNITGVLDVLSFDEEEIICETHRGILEIKGLDLHVVNLNLDEGILNIEGDIYGLLYLDTNSFSNKSSSFFDKLFK